MGNGMTKLNEIFSMVCKIVHKVFMRFPILPIESGFPILIPHREPPYEFICPVSASVMTDPVTVASGQILDRISVEVCKKLDIIPILSDGTVCNISFYTPNKITKSKIIKWCNNNKYDREADRLEKLVRTFMESRQPPKFYVCPLSGSLMADPVLVPSGNTFERNFIQACNNLNIIPVLPDGTKHDISDVIQNKPIKIGIYEWCKSVRADPPKPIEVEIAEKIILELKKNKGKIQLSEPDLSKRCWYLS